VDGAQAGDGPLTRYQSLVTNLLPASPAAPRPLARSAARYNLRALTEAALNRNHSRALEWMNRSLV
jgi:hypothetical protein